MAKEALAPSDVYLYVHEVVKGLDLKPVVDACSEDGGRLYGPSPTLKGWLYAHGLR